MLAIFILVFGVFSRVILHVPNFTPVLALALFSGAYLPRKYAFILPVVLMMISDIVLGAHETMPYTWGSIFLISLLGLWLKNYKDFKNIFGMSLVSSLIFFIITNLGVWLVSSLYPFTMAGLTACFILAIPFFKSTLLSTLFYAFVLFYGYEWVALRLKKTRLAYIVL